jgi:hypothetical protein
MHVMLTRGARPRRRVGYPANTSPRDATRGGRAPTGQHPNEIAGPSWRLSAAGDLAAQSL